jgi:hypothetical protein
MHLWQELLEALEGEKQLGREDDWQELPENERLYWGSHLVQRLGEP